MPRVTERIDGQLLADQLVDAPATLRVLWARTTLHTDALCELVTTEGFPLLSGLDLHNGDMTDTGAKSLLDCHELVEQLVYLGIGDNQVSAESLRLLKLLCPGMVDS